MSRDNIDLIVWSTQWRDNIELIVMSRDNIYLIVETT